MRFRTPALAAVALLCSFTAAPAHAETLRVVAVVPDLNLTAAPLAGLTCGMEATTNLPSSNLETGVAVGGPLTSLPLLGNIELRCTVQVGGANGTHAGTDLAVVTSSGPGVVVAPGQVTYPASDLDPVFLCTQATIAGTTYYWNFGGKNWSTSANVGCALAIELGVL